MKADAATEAAIKALMDQFNRGYMERDMEVIRSACAQDPDVMIYGTGADEKRIGWSAIEEQVKRDWSQAESTSISFDWTSISAAGDVAWVATDVTFNMSVGGQSMQFQGRGTLVAEKRGDDWQIVHSHFSFPASGQDEGESFPEG